MCLDNGESGSWLILCNDSSCMSFHDPFCGLLRIVVMGLGARKCGDCSADGTLASSAVNEMVCGRCLFIFVPALRGLPCSF